MAEGAKVRTCLWFQENGQEAAEFYVSLLPDSRIETAWTQPDEPKARVIDFTLAGTPYQILEAGPEYSPTPAASISVATEDQAETDRLWQTLLEGGGSEVACGWLTDRFGVSWQIIPRRLFELSAGDDRAAAARVQQAMMQMVKIDIAALNAAAEPTE